MFGPDLSDNFAREKRATGKRRIHRILRRALDSRDLHDRRCRNRGPNSRQVICLSFSGSFCRTDRYFGGCFGKLLDPAVRGGCRSRYRFSIPGPEFCRPASLSVGASILARELSSGCARRFRMRKSSAFRAERHRACRDFSTASPSTLSVSIGWPNLALSASAFSRDGRFKAISIPWCYDRRRCA